ncbi:hypothetical protein [Nocardia sp. CY41]|uniref:hypothetical protein n=1 Tax=Nocardia sp. CY41 TaxID=2608686 RepID=UPI00135B40B1|nr:hypothetical protein [Nocardia sp. CY41]
MTARRTWLDGRVNVFMAETNRLGLTCPRDPIGREIQARVTAVAATMGITEASARREFDDTTIREMARDMAAELEAEQPGADPMTLPPTHIVSTAVAGRTSAGLAVVAQLAISGDLPSLDEDTAENVHQAIALICSWGVLTECSAGRPGGVAVPEALIHRTIREFGTGIARLDNGVVPHDGGDPRALAAALADNMHLLQAEL